MKCSVMFFCFGHLETYCCVERVGVCILSFRNQVHLEGFILSVSEGCVNLFALRGFCRVRRPDAPASGAQSHNPLMLEP